MRVLITGGAGFIGSHLVGFFSTRWGSYEDNEIIILDNMGYASSYENISEALEKPNVRFVLADICNYAIYDKFMEGVDLVIHTAAESHVDNSFYDPTRFVKSNVEGTQVLLHACKEYKVQKIIHFSTDEVYGGSTDGTIFSEKDVLNPTNPYSASKAAAEMMVNSYVKSFKLPIITVRPNNVYGIAQHCEKLIPTCCYHLQKGLPIPIHGYGLAERDYLSVKDLCQAIGLLVSKGREGEVYNIGVNDSYRVIDVAHMFARIADINCNDAVNYISDRLHNDAKYPMWSEKIWYDTGWTPKHKLSEDVVELWDWFTAKELPFAHGWFKNA